MTQNHANMNFEQAVIMDAIRSSATPSSSNDQVCRAIQGTVLIDRDCYSGFGPVSSICGPSIRAVGIDPRDPSIALARSCARPLIRSGQTEESSGATISTDVLTRASSARACSLPCSIEVSCFSNRLMPRKWSSSCDKGRSSFSSAGVIMCSYPKESRT